MSKKIESVRAIFNAAAERFNALHVDAVAKLNAAIEASADESELKALKKVVSNNATLRDSCAKCAKMSDSAINVLIEQKIDAQAMTEQSREFMKRAVFMFEALALKSAVSERAFDAVLQRLASKRDAALSKAQLQREMQHKTTTQASYFCTFCEFFKFASYNKTSEKLEFNYDAYYLNALMQIYKAIKQSICLLCTYTYLN